MSITREISSSPFQTTTYNWGFSSKSRVIKFLQFYLIIFNQLLFFCLLSVSETSFYFKHAFLVKFKMFMTSFFHITDYCSESQSSLIHSCRTPESSKYINHEISVTKPVSSPKAPISINPPPSSHTNELNHLNANGNEHSASLL